MGVLRFFLMTVVLGWATPVLAQAALDDPPPHLRIELVPETYAPRAGSEVAVALATTPQPGWHGYWQNPGDAGFPAKFAWTLPPGVTAGPPIYPPPERLLVSGLMNYVFERSYAPIVALRIPPGQAAGTRLPVRLHLQYLVCTAALCVPEQGDFAITLTVGDGAVAAGARARFDGWRRALPQPLGAGAVYQASGGTVRIAVPYPVGAAGKDAYFYPLTAGAIDYAAPQAVARDGDRMILSTKGKPVGPIAGVLRVDGRALALTAVPGSVPASMPPPAAAGWATAVLAFLGAVLGGLILNVMPCVFPILSLKALSLAKAGGDERAARAEALAYAGGAVAMCVALGAAILALRAGGSVAGWAFQLQDGHVVMLLLLLALAIALNLAGLFELAVPGVVSRGGGGAAGAFGTGALAAFVATPCAGPFLGVALGAALVLPWFAALMVFAGLGFGLAVPFLLLGFVPALRRRLPRPGAWMATLRRILSIPMFVTAVALAWLLGRQAGADGMALALLVALAFAVLLWIGGRRQARGRGFGSVVLAGLALVAAAGAASVRPARATPAMAAGTEPFSEIRLAQLRAAGRPVFAYFTADWCLSCKVNERIAIDTDAVRAAFQARNVAVLVGDWTNGDPVLGRFIAAHGRAGVPLYLYYPAGGGDPQELPQILTPGLLTAL